MNKKTRIAWIAAAALSVPACAVLAGELFPADPEALTRTIPIDAMDAFLKAVNGKGPVTVSEEGKSAGGHPLYLVHLNRGGEKAPWRVFFYAQQHGNEVSSKDALLYFIRDIAEHPDHLSDDADVWIMPSVNPDGAIAATRRNGAGADLNRDHMQLEQPETQTLHRIFRRLRPHAGVDCHEYDRDAFLDEGWIQWPIITLDGLNNPLLDPDIIAAAREWVEGIGQGLGKAGHPFLRYSVGGLPPDGERRNSAPDIDSGLNALGMYGGLSFIAEAGASREHQDPSKELRQSMAAYREIFRQIIRGPQRRGEVLALIEKSRQRQLPDFIPVNYLWVNPRQKIVEHPMIEAATGKTKSIPTANFMTDLAVKKSVSAPRAYIVDAGAADVFRVLLNRHGIPFETLSAAQTLRVERSRLLKVEEEFDEVYNRYPGRTIVKLDAPADRAFPPGSLRVPLAGEAAVRAALVLEPNMMYGLYQYPKYKALVSRDGTCPVWREPKSAQPNP